MKMMQRYAELEELLQAREVYIGDMRNQFEAEIQERDIRLKQTQEQAINHMKQMKENTFSQSDSKQTHSTSGKPHTMPPNYFTSKHINSFSHSVHDLQTTQPGTLQFKHGLNDSTRNLNSHITSGCVDMTNGGPF